MPIPYQRTMGTDMIPTVRLAAWGKEPCDWPEHWWIKFIHNSLGDTVVMILCRNCGRTPTEALAALSVVVP